MIVASTDKERKCGKLIGAILSSGNRNELNMLWLLANFLIRAFALPGLRCRVGCDAQVSIQGNALYQSFLLWIWVREWGWCEKDILLQEVERCVYECWKLRALQDTSFRLFLGFSRAVFRLANYFTVVCREGKEKKKAFISNQYLASSNDNYYYNN